MEASNEISSTRAGSRKTRVYVFRDWILEKYSSILQPGDIILDCAGGKGDLSFLLTNADGYRSVVLDPRITKNRHIVKSIKYLRDHPEEARKRTVPGLPTYQPLAALLPKFDGKELSELQSPQHMRILVDKDLVEAVKRYKQEESGSGDTDESWGHYWSQAQAKGKEATPLGYKEEEEDVTEWSQAQAKGKEATPLGYKEEEEDVTEEEVSCSSTKDPKETKSGPITSAVDAIKTILEAKLVVGFHPDQATDYAIELAEALGVPYAVVPCCVFPSEFPDRRLADGSKVKYYADLTKYLQEQHPESKIERLDFHFSGGTAKDLVFFAEAGSSMTR